MNKRLFRVTTGLHGTLVHPIDNINTIKPAQQNKSAVSPPPSEETMAALLQGLIQPQFFILQIDEPLSFLELRQLLSRDYANYALESVFALKIKNEEDYDVENKTQQHESNPSDASVSDGEANDDENKKSTSPKEAAAADASNNDKLKAEQSANDNVGDEKPALDESKNNSSADNKSDQSSSTAAKSGSSVREEKKYKFLVLLQEPGKIALPMQGLQSAFVKPQFKEKVIPKAINAQPKNIQMEDFIRSKL